MSRESKLRLSRSVNLSRFATYRLTRRRLRRFPEDERGLLSLTMAMVVLAFALITGAMGNVMQRLAHKTQTQASADAAAVSLATLRSRGLNAITANNHLIGELSAMLVIHEALNGENPCDNGRKETEEWGKTTDLAKVFVGISENTDAKAIVDDANDLRLEATLYDTQLNLLKWTLLIQSGEALGRILEETRIPIVSQVGMALRVLCKLGQTPIYIEWQKAMLLENTSCVLSQGRRPTHAVLMILSQYGDQLAIESSLAEPAKNLTQALQSANGCSLETYPSAAFLTIPIQIEAKPSNAQEGLPRPLGNRNYANNLIDWLLTPLRLVLGQIDNFLSVANNFPDWLKLPPWLQKIKDEAGRITDTLRFEEFIESNKFEYASNPSFDKLKKLNADWAEAEHSQHVRLTYPMVNALRMPLINMFNNELFGFPFGNAANYYPRWSTRLTLSRTVQLRRDGIHVYRIQDSSSDTKGKETWATSSDSADALFAVSVIATREFPTPFSSVFGDPTVKQFTATAQAISYPSNKRATGIPDTRQPIVGWDTLAWDAEREQAVEYPNVTIRSKGGFLSFDFLKGAEIPPMRMPWTAKLVPHLPATYTKMALTSEVDAMKKTLPEALLLNHH